jgi:hypothetical protein
MEEERIARIQAFYTPAGINHALNTLGFSSDGPLAHQGDSIKVVLGLYM